MNETDFVPDKGKEKLKNTGVLLPRYTCFMLVAVAVDFALSAAMVFVLLGISRSFEGETWLMAPGALLAILVLVLCQFATMWVLMNVIKRRTFLAERQQNIDAEHERIEKLKHDI